MKTKLLLLCCLALSFPIVGCQGGDRLTAQPETRVPVPTSTLVPAPPATNTLPALSPTARLVATDTLVPTNTPTAAPLIQGTIQAEARLRSQCINIVPNLPADTASTGVVVLHKGQSIVGQSRPETFLMDMETGKRTQIALPDENLVTSGVTPDRNGIAFSSVFLTPEGKISKQDLIIANATGQRLKVIPFDESWLFSPGWIDNEHLAFQLHSQDPSIITMRKHGSLVVLDPFSGERQTLTQDYPGFLHSPQTILPDWDGWFGIVYDPQRTLAVYPYSLGGTEERYTYGIWDMSKHKLVANLKSILNTFAAYNYFPMPRWSLDGSSFIFVGAIASSKPVENELYRVGRDGQSEQLTHLSTTAFLWESSYSWSPDGKYIAMLLGPYKNTFDQPAQVAVLDTTTLEVTDYCIPIRSFSGVWGTPPTPIWSPDSKQFLVEDWFEKEQHSRVILVDIAQGFAAELARDLVPEAWLFGSDP